MPLPAYGVLVLWLAASGVWAQAVRRGDITRNPETGGLENILVELDQALESSQCKNILASLKVCNSTSYRWLYVLLDSWFNKFSWNANYRYL